MLKDIGFAITPSTSLMLQCLTKMKVSAFLLFHTIYYVTQLNYHLSRFYLLLDTKVKIEKRSIMI